MLPAAFLQVMCERYMQGGALALGLCLLYYGSVFSKSPSQLKIHVKGTFTRGGIFKLLRSPGIDPPTYVDWQAGTTTLLLRGS
jgi:hypothetical protein